MKYALEEPELEFSNNKIFAPISKMSAKEVPCLEVALSLNKKLIAHRKKKYFCPF